MLEYSFSQWLLYFTIYSVFGWVCECIWCSAGQKKIVNRGFLSGPYCPIYGFGALLILLFVEPFAHWPALVFVVGVVTASVLEYFTGWLLETLFKTRWWDYSARKFNIKGRVCLRNSLLFGGLSLCMVYLLQPNAVRLVQLMQPATQRVAASIIAGVFLLDFVHTLATLTNLEERLTKLRAYIKDLEAYNREYKWLDTKDWPGSVQKLRALCEADPQNEQARTILAGLDKLVAERKGDKRLAGAFPSMVPRAFAQEFGIMRQEWQNKWEARHPRLNRAAAACKAYIHKTVEESKPHYQKITLSHLVWVFMIGSVIGYVLETGYCFIVKGYVESRQGMLYGPFSQIYGFGAVVLALALTPLARHNNLVLFIGGGLVGGLFEALCSFVQQAAFGTVSWEYSKQAVSFFGGRTSLGYMFFWAVLSVVYMRYIYPLIVSLTERIPKRPRRFFTWLIAVLLIADMALSGVAVARWTQRQQGVPATNAVQQFMDKHYDDAVMKEIYPNMKIPDKKG